MNKPVVIDSTAATPAPGAAVAIARPPPSAEHMQRYQNIEELRQAARRRLPKGVFEYFDRGTMDELSLRDNRTGFQTVKLRNKVCIDVTKRSTEATIFGKPLSMPLAVGPTGAAGVCWFEGELALARAAARFGVPFTLAVLSLSTIEAVAAAGQGARQWFQLYIWPEREQSHALVRRAKDAGFETLIVTVDTQVSPVREYNRRNGFTMPFFINGRAVWDVMLHPRWAIGTFAPHYFKYGMPALAHRPKPTKGGERPSLSGGDVTWEDIKRLRDLWKGPMILKGLHRPEDAARAAAEGLDAIVISNHGGRNLDTAVNSLDVLPEIKAEVGDKMKVIVDSGIRRGGDILKARALGADLVLTGRATLYGTCVGGEEGAYHALNLLRNELETDMGFTGCCTNDEIGPQVLWQPKR